VQQASVLSAQYFVVTPFETTEQQHWFWLQLEQPSFGVSYFSSPDERAATGVTNATNPIVTNMPTKIFLFICPSLCAWLAEHIRDAAQYKPRTAPIVTHP
jgi:hypothetical protein